MAGIEDILNISDPETLKQIAMMLRGSPQDDHAANMQGLVAAGLGMMANPGRSGWSGLAQSVGHGGLLGMAAKQNYQNEQQARALGRLQGVHGLLGVQQQLQDMKDQAEARSEWVRGQTPSQPAYTSGPPPVAPGGAMDMFGVNAPPINPAPMQQPAPAMQSPAPVDPYTHYMQIADKIEAAAQRTGNPILQKQADSYRERALKFRDENQGIETVMVNGTPTLMQRTKYRGLQPVDAGIQPKPDIHWADTGSTVAPMNNLTGGPLAGATPIPKTQSADSIASNATSRRGQDLADARSREQNAIALTGKQVEQVHTIRKELNSLQDVQNYRAALPMLKSAQTAPNTRSGDLDVIYAVGKALDPGSVVREGELNLVIKSGNLPQQLTGAASYVMKGGKLPPDQRAELLDMLSNRVAQLKQAHDAAAAPFAAQANASGLPWDQIYMQPPTASAGAMTKKEDSGGLTKAEQRELDQLRKRFGRPNG